MTRCPGCFKARHVAFCGTCRKRLFGGAKVSAVLPFSRPAYDQVKWDSASDRMSISGIQTKISLALDDGQLKMVASGGQYILKPRDGVYSGHIDATLAGAPRRFRVEVRYVSGTTFNITWADMEP